MLLVVFLYPQLVNFYRSHIDESRTKGRSGQLAETQGTLHPQDTAEQLLHFCWILQGRKERQEGTAATALQEERLNTGPLRYGNVPVCSFHVDQ